MQIHINYEPEYEVIPVRRVYKDGTECRCRVFGEDDGNRTCWEHHDCTQGYCTHIDIDGDE